MKTPLRVVQYGVGPIGLESVRTVLAKQQSGLIELVGAIDADPNKVGRDLAELLKRDESTGVIISDDAERTLTELKPDVVLHTTSSFLDRMSDQLVLCARAGVHVVSSTEELAYPFDRHAALAEELDAVARENGVVLLGTGVNPGYAMDTLALAATGICTEVGAVQVERVVDAGKRREPLQRKVGAGMTAADFEERKKTGTFGHIGLRESLLMVAAGLGWDLERIEETLEPVLSNRDVTTAYLQVGRGQVAGIHHAITGYIRDEAVLSLDLKMFVGAEDPRDAVRVDGTPPMHLVVQGGIFGDTATVAALVNMAPLVVGAQPGLRTMKDLPVPRAFAATPFPLREGGL